MEAVATRGTWRNDVASCWGGLGEAADRVRLIIDDKVPLLSPSRSDRRPHVRGFSSCWGYSRPVSTQT